jgi:hypothetical protein
VRRNVVMVKQPNLFSPKFGATSSHVFTHSPQDVAVKLGIHSLASWDRCFALPQLLYSWRHHSGIFWIPPHIWAPTNGLRAEMLAALLRLTQFLDTPACSMTWLYTYSNNLTLNQKAKCLSPENHSLILYPIRVRCSNLGLCEQKMIN